MRIDCDNCVAREWCSDCVVGAVLGAADGSVEVDECERTALNVLADAGLVPRLRLVTSEDADRRGSRRHRYDACDHPGGGACPAASGL